MSSFSVRSMWASGMQHCRESYWVYSACSSPRQPSHLLLVILLHVKQCTGMIMATAQHLAGPIGCPTMELAKYVLLK